MADPSHDSLGDTSPLPLLTDALGNVHDAPPMLRKVTSSRLVAETNYLRLEELTYVDEGGLERTWSAIRRGHKPSDAAQSDAIAIFAVCTSKNHDAKTICVTQFRPPTNAFTVEFPGGFVDKGESLYTAAVRELREETGFHSRPIGLFPGTVLDPGISSVAITSVVVHVDFDDPSNYAPETEFSDDEAIGTHIVPLNSEFLGHLRKICLTHDAELYTGLESLALGIGLGLPDRVGGEEALKRIKRAIKVGGGIFFDDHQGEEEKCKTA